LVGEVIGHIFKTVHPNNDFGQVVLEKKTFKDIGKIEK
jgi:hypothetical protein